MENSANQQKSIAGNANDAFDVFNVNSFDLTITLGYLAAPIIFPVRILQTVEEKEARQNFYAQKPGLIASGKHLYNCEVIAKLCTDAPRNLPHFEELYNETAGEPGAAGNDPKSRLKKAIFDYFNRDSAFLVELADMVVNQHTRETQPGELFRGV